MADSQVVTGLVAKRAELAGRMERCRQEREQLLADVEHLDRSIKLFAPDYKLEGIRAKRPRQRNRYFVPGECQRLVLEIPRDALNRCRPIRSQSPWCKARAWSRKRP